MAVRIGRDGGRGRAANFFGRVRKKRVRRVRMSVRPPCLDAGGEAQGAQAFLDEAVEQAGVAGAALKTGGGPFGQSEATDRPNVGRAIPGDEKIAVHVRQDRMPMRQDRT
ncbi:hypothetical protein [Brevundimonas sp.]|uniref:hypothetical protein n=1 Tax=Brevundimonas sp. TaxID=1871086 RepID=UPI0025B887BC|nr:hypothetical protein [Brevundimonas sp.]